MTTKQDLEAIENQISAIQVSSHGETVNPVLAHGGFKIVEKGRNWGWLLSGFISLNILLLGIAIVCGSVFNKIQISSSHLLIFLILIVILTTVWMVYYKIHTSRVFNAVLYKDSHAGPVWLRGKSSFVPSNQVQKGLEINGFESNSTYSKSKFQKENVGSH